MGLHFRPAISLLAFTLLVAPAARADEGQPRRFVDGAIGGGVYQISDDLVRGLRWQGPSGEMRGAFRYAGERHRQEVHLRIGMSYLHNRYDKSALSMTHHFGYAYVRRVLLAGPWGTLFLGGQLREDVDLQYYIDWDEEHAYWLSAYTLAAAARYEISVGPRHAFDLAAALPLVGWVGRPPERRYYKADNLKDPGWLVEKPFEGLRFASLDEYQAVHLDLAYTYHPGRGCSLRLATSVDYRRTSFPRPVQVLANNFTVGFTYAY